MGKRLSATTVAFVVATALTASSATAAVTIGETAVPNVGCGGAQGTWIQAVFPPCRTSSTRPHRPG